MAIARMTIHGFRGFATPGDLKFAVPNGNPGSGLTYLVGPNNSGKSTAIESLNAFSGNRVIISEGKRNKRAGDRVEIQLYYSTGEHYSLVSVEPGSAQTVQTGQGGMPHPNKILVISSRRSFNPFFNEGSSDRNSYVQQNRGVPNQRGVASGLSRRLVQCAEEPARKSQLNAILTELVGYEPIGRSIRPIPANCM